MEKETQNKVIGRGIWIDKVAKKIIERENKLDRSTSLLRVESGLGASGIPHIGSLSDAIRAYGIKLALQDQGYKSELVAFSDDMDGLRKVPVGLPDSLAKCIGMPVSMIQDPFGCHDSYGDHMSSLLKDALDRCSIEYSFQSATEVYQRGLLDDQILTLLENADLIGKKISDMLGQKKFEKALPYFPLCERCRRIYVAEAYQFLPKEKSVLYRCKGSEIGGKLIEGCGHEDKVSVLKGLGKLSWKGEFAARWVALDVRFEAYGKDIADSVELNDWISDNVFHFPHPYHVKYEMFLDKSGKKISKSAGNVFTPQTWLRYGSPESLLLLMFKRVAGSRTLSIEDIPTYIDEYDFLEDVYFGKTLIDNPTKLRKLKSLYEYVNLLKTPLAPEAHIPYEMLVQLASVAPPKDRLEYISNKLKSYGVVKSVTPDLTARIDLASNWASDFKTIRRAHVMLTDLERSALKELLELIEQNDDPEKIQVSIFEVARKHNLPPPSFFKLIYRILIGSDRGPRLGRYIVDIGKREASKLLFEQLK